MTTNDNRKQPATQNQTHTTTIQDKKTQESNNRQKQKKNENKQKRKENINDKKQKYNTTTTKPQKTDKRT